MKKAKELFEELGYIVSNDLTSGTNCKFGDEESHEMHSISAIKIEDREYGKEDEYIEDESDLDFQKRIGKYRVKEIFFEYSLFEPNVTIRYKVVKVSTLDNEHFGVEFNGFGLVGESVGIGKFGVWLSPDEIKAVNQQIKELSW